MQVEIIEYENRYKEDFKRLNEEWINQYFALESEDLEQLNHPEANILNKGGRIFMARYGEEIIGTVTLKKHADTQYELAKMAVSPKFQGIGAGKMLGEHLIAEAKKLGCTYLFLESNQKLGPALNLYKKLGFIEVPIGETPYNRADYKAEMYLSEL